MKLEESKGPGSPQWREPQDAPSLSVLAKMFTPGNWKHLSEAQGFPNLPKDPGRERAIWELWWALRLVTMIHPAVRKLPLYPNLLLQPWGFHTPETFIDFPRQLCVYIYCFFCPEFCPPFFSLENSYFFQLSRLGQSLHSFWGPPWDNYLLLFLCSPKT